MGNAVPRCSLQDREKSGFFLVFIQIKTILLLTNQHAVPLTVVSAHMQNGVAAVSN